jgi:uncharacterized protein
MPITMYSASLPAFVRMLDSLCVCLDKAQAHAEAKKFDSSVYLGGRLAPDMLPFTKHVQIACDMVKFFAARLSGTTAPKFDDTEASLAELRARALATIEFLKSVSASQINGTEDKDIAIPRPDGSSLNMKGEAYLHAFVLPNFYFHLTTAYALLRHNGVPLGKMDFLGDFQK